jgi:membrane protein YqaA with SNARE-associated domain
LGVPVNQSFIGLWELFLSAFISATIAPGGSEAVLALLSSTGNYPIAYLILSATVGNTLGAMTTWGLGMLAAQKYPVATLLSADKQKALNIVKMRGLWVLFFSWLPIVGDAFCFAAMYWLLGHSFDVKPLYF